MTITIVRSSSANLPASQELWVLFSCQDFSSLHRPWARSRWAARLPPARSCSYRVPLPCTSCPCGDRPPGVLQPLQPGPDSCSLRAIRTSAFPERSWSHWSIARRAVLGSAPSGTTFPRSAGSLRGVVPKLFHTRCSTSISSLVEKQPHQDLMPRVPKRLQRPNLPS